MPANDDGLGFVPKNDLGFVPRTPSLADAVERGALRGAGDRILARASALGLQQGGADPDNPLQSLDALTSRPVDPAQFEADRARILQGRLEAGAAAEAEHPAAFLAGRMAPAVASAVIPGAGTVRGAMAIGGGMGLLGSESDKPAEVATEGATGAVLSGAGTKLLQLLGSALGKTVQPATAALRDTIAAKVADRSAAAAEGAMRSAQGTAGSTAANAFRTVGRLAEDAALPQSEIAANQAALATPEAQQLATRLAQKGRATLPTQLAQLDAADALMGQTAADAAAARAPAAVAATEAQLREEAVKRLLTRYLLPAAGGAAVDKATGGSGAMGAVAGLGMRPTARALLRAVTSPGFTAPASRALADLSEWLANSATSPVAGRLAATAEPAEQQATALLRALLAPPQRAQLASGNGTE